MQRPSTSMEDLWLELIGAAHLTGQQTVDGLKPDNDVKDMPTPKGFGRVGNGCTDKGETA